VCGDGFGGAQVGEERERDGRCDRRSRRGRPTEIGEGTDYIEVAVFTGDFIECHGGLLLLGMGAFERQNCTSCQSVSGKPFPRSLLWTACSIGTGQ